MNSESSAKKKPRAPAIGVGPGPGWVVLWRGVEWACSSRRHPFWGSSPESARSKGQRYLTLVYDLERNRLVWVGENRDAQTMQSFFQWLGPHRAHSILIVCCNMWAVYVAAMREKLPHAFLFFDRFHVVQHLNRAVDEVRRQCWRRLSDDAKGAFKKTRWLWLKNPWNLKDEEKRRLSALCQANQPMVRAYYL